MPNLLANVELSTAQSAPVAWADVLGMSAVVDVESPDSVILLLATIPLKSVVSIETAEFRFAVGGVREGPFAQGQHQAPSAIGSGDIATFAYALTGLSGSQTFSVQWQQVLSVLDLNTAKVRNFQVIEFLAGDKLNILGTAYDRSSGIDSAAAYVDVDDLDLTVPVVNALSLILLSGTLPIGLTDASDRVASCRLADGGVGEGGEAIIYQDFVFEGTGLTSLMRAKDGISGMHTFSLQWKTELANTAAKISTANERSLQALEFRPARFPVVESTVTSVTSTSITTHTIDTPGGIEVGELLIAFIGLENSTSPASQWSGVTDGFTEIKDKSTGGTDGASVGVFYKVADGTEGANITVTSVDAERAAHCMYRISDHDPSIAPEITAGAFANSAAPNPDSLTPAGGVKDFLYMVFAAFQKDDETITAFPTDYDENQVNHGNFSGATIGVATRDRTGSPEDPGAFTMSGVEEWQAFTLAVHPFAATVALTGTATGSIEENDILDGGKTIILTLTNDEWVAAGATFDAQRQAIIDGMVSAQISGSGFRLWNDEVTPNEVVGAVVRTSDTVVTITLTASPLYNIFTVDPSITQETITVTVPASALETSAVAIVAQPDFTVDQSPISVDLTGTMLPSSTEAQIVAGGRTILMTLKQDNFTSMWGATQAQLIIDGLNSAQSELTGWNNEVRDKMPVTDVVRTGNQLLTITVSAQAGYDITDTEEITATIPGSVLDSTPPDFDATPNFFVTEIPVAVISGTAVPDLTDAEVVAGGETIIITLMDDEWVAAGAPFNAIRQDIIDGLDSAGVEATGWNAEVRDKLGVTDVTRNSATVVTVDLSNQAAYAITVPETITVTVPASALDQTALPIVATPTFDVILAPSGTHQRSRRGGAHAEDTFEVEEFEVETFEVNKFE